MSRQNKNTHGMHALMRYSASVVETESNKLSFFMQEVCHYFAIALKLRAKPPHGDADAMMGRTDHCCSYR